MHVEDLLSQSFRIGLGEPLCRMGGCTTARQFRMTTTEQVHRRTTASGPRR